MTEMHINVTEKCNLNCPFCFSKKSSQTMTKEIIDNVIDYVIEELERRKQTENCIEHTFNIIGGEAGIVDLGLSLYLLDSFKAKYDNHKPVKYVLSTNLVYSLTDAHIAFFKQFDQISISYDYSIRFNSLKNRLLWFNNIKTLQKAGFENIIVTVCLTKDLIQNFPPNLFFDFMLGTGIKHWVVQTLSCMTISNKAPWLGDTNTIKDLSSTNKEKCEWQYKLFELYDKARSIDKELLVLNNFEAIYDSMRGVYYGELAGNCMETNITISPNGDVAQCPFTTRTPYYNVLTKEYNKENWDGMLELQNSNKNDKCKGCDLLKYCNGNCSLSLWDETGCVMPKKIYAYLQLKEGLVNG